MLDEFIREYEASWLDKPSLRKAAARAIDQIVYHNCSMPWRSP